ncbi:hypothetical protein D3C76_1284850 [compost metagenome]
MHGVLALVVAEAQEHPQRGEGFDHIDILAPLFMRRNGNADALDDLLDDPSFLEVDMDGVSPPVVDIGQLPDLVTALGNLCPWAVHIEEFFIDRPHAPVTLEDPTPHRRRVDFGLSDDGQRSQGCRNPTQIL